MPTIGIIHSGSEGPIQKKAIDMFILSLENAGYVDGNNVSILKPYGWGRDDPDQLLTPAKDFVQNKGVDVLVAAGGTISAQKAKEATPNGKPPVVFTSVAHRARPASTSHMTGVCARTTENDPTRLSLLQELMPGETRFGALVNSSRPDYKTQKDLLNDAAATLNLSLDPQDVVDATYPGGNPNKIKSAFDYWATQVKPPITAAIVTANPFFNNHAQDVIDAAKAFKIAAIYQWRGFVDAGGLISYGPKLLDAYALAASYVARILNKEKPKDLPVVVLSEFELVINLSTAKTLKIPIPDTLRARADDFVT
jgi:ABC-type uncharacterized transport system substrate-binding protein